MSGKSCEQHLEGGGDWWRGGGGLVSIVGALSLGAGAGEESWGGVFCELKGMLIEGMRVDSAGGEKLESALGFGRGLRGGELNDGMQAKFWIGGRIGRRGRGKTQMLSIGFIWDRSMREIGVGRREARRKYAEGCAGTGAARRISQWRIAFVFGVFE